MEMTTRQINDPVAVTILALSGELDATNYLDVIGRIRDLYAGGSRNLLIDLGGVTFLSSSGLVALHSAALVMRGEQPPDPEAGWSTFHTMASDIEQGASSACKLLNPQPRVRKSLEVTGFDAYLPIFTDLDEALASFA
jgi:anti-anti-sigma regulatory factor